MIGSSSPWKPVGHELHEAGEVLRTQSDTRNVGLQLNQIGL